MGFTSCVGDRYHWRTPYTGMTEEEIVAHLQAAREFSFSDAVPSDCIEAALAGESAACCLSWAATKLETDFLFAGVDDTAGTIKVNCLPKDRCCTAPCTRTKLR